MFTSVKSIALATTLSVAALSSAAYAADPIAFSNVNVEASMSAAENGNALTVFPEIVTDLNTAVSERITASDDDSDPTIRIDVRKVSLNGNPMLTGSNEFNEIEGVVDITDDSNTIGSQSFAVNVAAYAADITVPEGYVTVAPSEEDFYDAMISGFADVVAAQVEEINTARAEREK